MLFIQHAKIVARGVNFEGNATIAFNGNNGKLDLSGSRVDGELHVAAMGIGASIVLHDMTLALPPTLTSNSENYPQDIRFARLRLLPSAYRPGSEAAYRAIRNKFHANRDREQEGLFYMFEKRAKRKAMPLTQVASWLPRSVSACYDWFAGYGQSYERALAVFVGVQVAFGLIYSWLSGRFVLGGTLDSRVAAFTFAQLVKPFELLSGREAKGWPFDGVYTGGSGVWTVVTGFHAVLSVTLITLALLALRWRFRRD